jgi:WD40 repeat protein
LWLARDKKDWRIDDRLPSRHHDGQISAIAFDGGKGNASAQIATTGSGGTELWGLDPKNATHHKFSETQASNRTDCALFSPDSSVLLVGSRDWFGRLLDPRNPGLKNTTMIRAFSHPSAVLAVAFDKRGKTAFTASVDVVCGWDLATGHQLGPDFDYEGRARFITVLSVNEQETLQLVTNEGVIYHWALPRPATDDFKTLRRQVEYRTMQRLDADGNRFVLTLDELLEIGKKLGRKSEW